MRFFYPIRWFATATLACVLVQTSSSSSDAQLQPLQIAKAEKSLVIETVRLKAASGSLVAGASAANALIQIYNGQTLIGSTLANDEGVWSVSMGQSLEPGRYTVRVVASDPQSGAKQTRKSDTYIVKSSGIALKKKDQTSGVKASGEKVSGVDAATIQQRLERRADQLGLLASERFERFLSRFGARRTTNTASNAPSTEAGSKPANSTADTNKTRESSNTNAVSSAGKKAKDAANQVAKLTPSKTDEHKADASEGGKTAGTTTQTGSPAVGDQTSSKVRTNSASQPTKPAKSNIQTTETTTRTPSAEKSPANGVNPTGADGDDRVANIMKSATDRLKKLLSTTPKEGDSKKQAVETPPSRAPKATVKEEAPKRTVLDKPKSEGGDTAKLGTNGETKKSLAATNLTEKKQGTASLSGTNSGSGKPALKQPQIPVLPVRRSSTNYQKQKAPPAASNGKVQPIKSVTAPSPQGTPEGEKPALSKPQKTATPARPSTPVADDKTQVAAAAPGNEKDEAANRPKREKPKVGRIPARLAKASLRVGDIDYEISQIGRGRIVASGKGRPGATISIRIGGRSIASSTVNDKGRWRIRVKRKLNPGRTKVILRMNDPATGNVQNARFEFETEPDAATRRPRRRASSQRRRQTITYDQVLRDKHIRTAPDTFSSSNRRSVYVVRPGDTLQSIAGRVYGDRGQWHALMRANRGRIDHPNQIYSGQVLRLN